MLERTHPYFDHSEADFFLAEKNDEVVGRIAAFENRRLNEKHDTKSATFYFFDSVDDTRVSQALFDAVFDWARRRGLDLIVGPLLSGGTSGQGILIEGYEHRAAMTLMGYNYPYYADLIEQAGFRKRRDYFSAQQYPQSFVPSEKIQRVIDITKKRGRFELISFKSKRELKAFGRTVGEIYNDVLASFNEGHKLTEREIEASTRDLLLIADPNLVKILTYDGNIAGFILAFPDISAAMQRARGKLSLRAILDLRRELKRSSQLIVNAVGILPQYQRLGGNALLYSELADTSRSQRFVHAELMQIAETTKLMLGDMKSLDGDVYKTHRLYERDL